MADLVGVRKKVDVDKYYDAWKRVGVDGIYS